MLNLHVKPPTLPMKLGDEACQTLDVFWVYPPRRATFGTRSRLLTRHT